MGRKKIKKSIIVVPARLDSSRLPKKVLADLNGKSMITFLVERIKKSKLINNIILATTDNQEDDLLVKKAIELDILVTRGSERDVLSRFCKVWNERDWDIFIRVTADCPFIDHFLIDDLIEEFNTKKFD